MRKVTQADTSTCLTQRTFNLERKALLQRLPLKRRDIRPSIRLEALVPKKKRAKLLEDLAADLRPTLCREFRPPIQTVGDLSCWSTPQKRPCELHHPGPWSWEQGRPGR
jgi:hypothetical protein